MRGATGATVLAVLAASLAAPAAVAEAPTAWMLVDVDFRGEATIQVWLEHDVAAEVEVFWTGGSTRLSPVHAAPAAFEGRVPGFVLGPSSRLVVTTAHGAYETGILGAPAGVYTHVVFAKGAPDARVAAPPDAPLAPRRTAETAEPPPGILLAGGALIATAYVLALGSARRPEKRATKHAARTNRVLGRPTLGAENEDLARYLDTTWPSAEAGRAAAEGLAPRHAGDVLDALSARGGIVAEIVAIRPSAMVLRVAGGCAYACGFLARAFESLATGPVIVEEGPCQATPGAPRDRPQPVVAGLHRRRWKPCEIVVHADLIGARGPRK
ncbi:MAG TPA: hypothetical protein VM889_11820 [Candidatus Thermoplasmatota archaeon]|nr:hypothetical protein [Candidatus Thermoplasmatota archaeon]